MEFYNLSEYSQNDICGLITNMVEENIELDFKDADSLSVIESKRKELAKDVSAFANSNGGILVYGIKENNHVASDISFIDGTVITKEWIDQVINSKIRERIKDVRIYPVRFDNDIKKSVYVIKIPRSYNAPHMCDNRFYKRYDFQSMAMEEYEVRDLYHRKSLSEIEIIEPYALKNYSLKTLENSQEAFVIPLIVGIKNISQTVERDYKVHIRIPVDFLSNYLGTEVLFRRLHMADKNYRQFIFPASSPIFQDETVLIYEFHLVVKRTPQNIYENQPVWIKLFYTSGKNEVSINIYDYIKKQYGMDIRCKLPLSSAI